MCWVVVCARYYFPRVFIPRPAFFIAVICSNKLDFLKHFPPSHCKAIYSPHYMSESKQRALARAASRLLALAIALFFMLLVDFSSRLLPLFLLLCDLSPAPLFRQQFLTFANVYARRRHRLCIYNKFADSSIQERTLQALYI